MTSPGASKSPIPPGVPSTIRGRWQRPALRWTTVAAAVLAACGLALPAPSGIAMAHATVTVVVAAPLLRVVWLCYRWAQERDWRFVAAGGALLLIVGTGAVSALLGG